MMRQRDEQFKFARCRLASTIDGLITWRRFQDAARFLNRRVFMFSFMRFTLALASIVFIFSIATAQQPTTVATVEVTASTKEAEVGQEVKLTVVAKDANGKVVIEQPSTYFAA